MAQLKKPGELSKPKPKEKKPISQLKKTKDLNFPDFPTPAEVEASLTQEAPTFDPVEVDTRTQREKTAELGRELFPEEAPELSTLEAEIERFKEGQKMERGFLEEQQRQEAILEASQLRRLGTQTDAAIAGTQAALAQGREGPISAGAPLVVQEFTQELRSRAEEAQVKVNMAQQRRAEISRRLNEAQRQGRSVVVRELQGELNRAEAEASREESRLLDFQNRQAQVAIQEQELGLRAQAQASDIEIANQAANRANLTTFQGILESGIELDTSGLISMSQQLNLPFETVYGAFQGAQAIREDKALSQQEKELKIRDLGLDLHREMRGITNSQLENVSYLENLYKSGASQETISRAKALLGIPDENDPMFKLDLAIRGYEAEIKKAESEGKIIDPQARLEFFEQYQDALERTGNVGVYAPTGDKYETSVTENGIRVNIEDGVFLDITETTRDEGQCGAFVNDVLGTSFGDKLADKTKWIDESILFPSAGMAFVQAGGYDLGEGVGDSGHVGIVESVNPDGTFNVVEANKHNDRKISRRTINGNDVLGFVKPPKADFIGKQEARGPEVSGFKQRVDLANAGVSTQTRTSNDEAFENALKTGNPDIIEEAVLEIERKKFLPRTEKIIDDFDKKTKNYYEIIDQKNRVDAVFQGFEAGEFESLVGVDQALVTVLGKMLDPGSVVRESEFNRTPESISAINRLEGFFERIAGGGVGITDEDRQDIFSTMNLLVSGAQKTFDSEVEKAKRRADVAGVPEEFLLGTLGIEGVAEPRLSDEERIQNVIPEGFGATDDELNQVLQSRQLTK